ncbi:ABC transporter substrate-binding protein [Oxyplasma meridianum]|uniref:ABC transporter substrate-binding protein n=1 Tax=Oxyplasma meridianum TaxID=3073602 RepID=A0AAX4NGU9_9ARCH
MNRQNKTIIAIVVVLVLLGSGLGYIHYASNLKGKGVILTIQTGYNSSTPLTRIVSLDPAATATLYALGSYKDLVGGNAYDYYPPNETLPNVTDYPAMDVEQIINLHPQAVISFTNYSAGQISEVLNASIDYIFLSAGSGTSMQIIEKQNTFLGKLTGTEKNATLINNWMNTSLKDLKQNATLKANGKPLRGFYYLSQDSLWTTGNNTFEEQYFQYSDIINIAKNYSSGFYQISASEIANGSPQIIFVNDYVNLDRLNDPPFAGTPAVKDNKIYVTPPNAFDEPDFRDIYMIQWMVDKAYGNVTIPPFPVKVQYSPDPLG